MENENAPLEPEYEDPVPMYANNVRFELTVWDLRIFFGQLFAQKPSNSPEVSWHTDVAIPWPQAKLMHLYLGINLALYEAENGKITIPASVLPPAISAPPAEVDTSNAQAVATFQMVQRMINEFREAETKG